MGAKTVISLQVVASVVVPEVPEVPVVPVVPVVGGVAPGVRGAKVALDGQSHFQRCSRLSVLACGGHPSASNVLVAHPR